MKHFRKNAIYNVLGWLLPALVFLGLTPVMIRQLGLEAFGVVALIQVVTGYMNVLNFGFAEALTKQVAASYETDRPQAGRVSWVGFQLFAAFGALGALVLLATAWWLAHDVLKIPAHLQADATTALQIGAAIFLFQMLAEFYRGTSIGCNRFDVPNLSRMLRIGLSGLLILLALHLETGIVGVMWGSLLGLLVGLVVNAWWMERILPLRPATGDTAAIRREVFHYSKHVFTMRLAGLFSSNLGQLFLGTLSSAASVGLYQVTVRAAETGAVFLNRILQVFFPGFAAMDIRTERERIREMFLSAFTLQVLFTTPFFLCVALEGSTLLKLWVGTQFAQEAAGIILLVCVAYWVSSLTNLATFLALSFGAPDLLSWSSIVRLVITAVAGYPLISQFGLVGAAWLLLLGEAQAFPFIVKVLRRTVGGDLVAKALMPVAIHGVVGLILYAVYAWLWRPSALYTPFAAPLFALLQVAIAVSLGALPAGARQRLKTLLKRA